MKHKTPNRWIYFQHLRQRLWGDRSFRIAFRCLIVWICLALLAPFLANDVPIIAKDVQGITSPLWKKWTASFKGSELLEAKDQPWNWAIYPLIPYHPSTLDKDHTRYAPPLSRSGGRSRQWTHWLGTDQVGRDVTAGLLHGCRTALMIGIGATGIALLIGLFVGGLAGYYGDDSLPFRYGQGILLLIWIFLGGFWLWRLSWTLPWIGMNIALVAWMVIAYILLTWYANAPKQSKQKFWAIDFVVMRCIETIQSLPGLLILLIFLAILGSGTIGSIILILGVLSWPTIAKYVRAELLAVRTMDYIKAGRLNGLSQQRLMWAHALPNALTPVLVTASFAITAAILTEAALSFLGIGLGPDIVTWGKMMANSRTQLNAWWTVVFPGLMIFGTVLTFNTLGSRLNGK